MIAPLIPEAAPEHNQMMAFAGSSGVIKRPGTSVAAISSIRSLDTVARAPSDNVCPGATTLTRTPLRANSKASTRLIPTGLRGSVRYLTLDRAKCGAGGHVDDRAAALRGHDAQRFLTAKEDPAEIDGMKPVPKLLCDVAN